MLPVETVECNNTMAGPCGDRTNFYSRNSTTFVGAGIYSATKFPDLLTLLGNGSGAYVGIDKVIFGNIALQSINAVRQYIYGTVSRQFFVGVFGLAVGSITPQSDPLPTLLSAMASVRAIPSNSFSYTAGSVKSIRPLLRCY
jgi:hypothetical protein